MIVSMVHKNRKTNRILPFLARFARRAPFKNAINRDSDQKHGTIITEVRRETTDDR